MCSKVLFALLLLSSASGILSRFAYIFSDGINGIVPDVNKKFSCEGRIYGYYADVDNGCKIFHVCVPLPDKSGKTKVLQYSFFCVNGTVFDQENLVCSFPEYALPCEQSTNFYDIINSEFGRINGNL